MVPAAANAEYLVVGGYAVAFHGRPRFTKGLGLWIGEEPSNLSRVLAALRARWANVPVEIISLEDLLAAKRATAREQDLADVRALERNRERS